MRQKYRKKSNQFVIAIQMNLEMPVFEYHKWGSTQQAKSRDWLVNNDGDVYTVDQDSFKQTYEKVELGKYVKTTAIWAQKAIQDGRVKTKEGYSHYETGDYLVSNQVGGSDAYSVSKEIFEQMYELVE